jgi:hypothetical protein
MRPIYLGLAFFLIGVIGFLGVNVYYNMMSLQTALIYTFAAVAICSLPIAAILEIVKWRKGQDDREQKKEK